MSTPLLRYHNSTLSFLPKRRNRKIQDLFHLLRIRASRRRVKQTVRMMFVRST